MNENRRDLLAYYWERYYPFFFSVLLPIAFWSIGFSVKNKKLEKIIDGSINSASIITGLLFALLGILISIKNSPLVKYVFQKYQTRVYLYIKQTIYSGFLTIIFANLLYVHVSDNPRLISHIIFFLWLGSAIFLLTSSYRIINILMIILANNDIPPERPPGNLMSPEEVEKLKKEVSRKK